MRDSELDDPRGKAVLNTWVKRCSKVIVFTSYNANATQYPMITLVPIKVKEKNNYDMSRKVWPAMAYLYKNHLMDYEWFLRADSDSYVIMENLRYLLSHHDPEQPVYFGQPFRLPVSEF